VGKKKSKKKQGNEIPGKPDPTQEQETTSNKQSVPGKKEKQPNYKQLTNPQAAIDSMEVHHHSSPTRKKWTHYFWDFFMLFLAVTAGFFVENQREHYIEHKREKQYINSLINDLKADTAKLTNIVTLRVTREKRLDSLGDLMNSSNPGAYTNDMYFFQVSAARTLIFRFVPNDGTMQQLKNSGALRLIRNHEVADSIASYDVSVRNFVRQGELEETLIHDYRSAAAKIFNALIFDQMLDADNNVSRLILGNPALLPFDKNDLSIWNYKLYSMKALNKANRRDARLLLRQAVNLLSTLKKEYQ
jgi:hypothetical protein